MKIKSDQELEKLRALLFNVIKIRTQMDGFSEPIIFQSSIAKILLDLEHQFSRKSIDKKKLNQNAFGIFRLVTESSELENSPFGKDLFALHYKIKDFIRTLESQ